MKATTKSALAARALAVCGVICAGTSGARAQTAALNAANNETPKMYFVQYPSAPLAEGTTDAAVDNDDSNFRSEASSKGVDYRQRLRFKSLWNGVSIEAKPSEVAKLRKLSSVKAVFPVQTYSLPPVTQPSPELMTAIQMTGADIAHNELGIVGKGVRVAVMDTGIDYTNPDLGGGFGPGTRVTIGWDFVGDDYDAAASPGNPALVPHPDPDPKDCNGHGTHVAGIIGANGDTTKGGVVGVAPGVTFGAYRVFGCSGSTSDDVMLAAMERILRDRMDVLNMSIGAAFNNFPGAPTAEAASRLVKKGVVVVASIGNSGASGLWSAGAPGVGDRVIGVASYDNRKSTNPAFQVGGQLFGYDEAAAAPLPPSSGTSSLSTTGTTSITGCSASSFNGVAGKTVLVRRGTCTFYVKAINAQTAGATGVVLYNNQPGRITPTVAGPQAIKIPVVMITAADGATVNSLLSGGASTLSWTAQTVSSDVATKGLISSFSSYGLAADLTLKPDIGAPGGFIWSTLPMNQGGHGSLSGTSMASPHVAGAVALLLEAKKILRSHGQNDDNGNDEGWRSGADDGNNLSRASLVRDVLQNSAHPAPSATGAGIDNVERQGAGMVDIATAVQATSYAYPGKLSLGDGNGPVTKQLVLVNFGQTSVSYTIAHTAALANGPEIFVPTMVAAAATLTASPSSVTLRPGEMRSINVTVAPPASLADHSLYGGYIVVTPSAGSAISVPYVGMKGDYQSIPVLSEDDFGPPLMLDGLYNPRDTYSLVGAQQPNVFFHTDLQARRLTLEVLDASGKSLGRAAEAEFWPRNSAPGTYFQIAWDGTYLEGQSGTKSLTAPNGQYQLKLSLEKPSAHPERAAKYETWTSPAFTIARP